MVSFTAEELNKHNRDVRLEGARKALRAGAIRIAKLADGRFDPAELIMYDMIALLDNKLIEALDEKRE